jgi:hypothetical protein
VAGGEPALTPHPPLPSREWGSRAGDVGAGNDTVGARSDIAGSRSDSAGAGNDIAGVGNEIAGSRSDVASSRSDNLGARSAVEAALSSSEAPNPQLPSSRLKDRTLTNLYNRRPDWFTEAHRRLDAAVFDAYGWPHDPSTSSGQALSDDEILARLLALNLERAGGQGTVPMAATEEATNEE